jgi:hypothetical protein
VVFSNNLIQDCPLGVALLVDHPQIVREAVKFELNDRIEVNFLLLNLHHSLLRSLLDLTDDLVEEEALGLELELVVFRLDLFPELTTDLQLGSVLIAVDWELYCVD